MKASLDQTQPESIVSRTFIEQVTPETGNISTVIFIAPSISGISGNAGGIGNYFSTTMRGFTDGQYNVTYDGIAFGDTNNPTHHPNDYFPTSTIGAAVVDRGPGAAGDLGQANYGGAIHYFSPDVSDKFGLDQKVTYGTFDTAASVTTLNTGTLDALGGGKLYVNLDERRSDTELSDSGGYAWNQMAKYVLPIGSKFTLTALFSHAWSRYNFPDSNGPGETIQQVDAYGKDFQLTSDPNEEHWYKWNFERKQTYFNYIDMKYAVAPTVTLEDELYDYFYSNKTDSTKSNADLVGVNSSSKPTKTLLGGAPIGPNDIAGYIKRNDYTVIGDIVRLTDDLPFGTLKFGGLVEGSNTYRQKEFDDFTQNFTPDLMFTNPNGTKTSCKTCENSNWLQEQVFVDFYWRPLDNLTITPGFKYVNFKREINASEDGSVTPSGGEGSLKGTNTYSSPLYFLTANYKITPFWSAYGQFATSFLIPQLAELQVPGVELQHLKPETTTNYQLGTVFSRGALTADADVYLVDAANTNVACQAPDPVGGGTEAATCNAGKVRYSGVEGEAAYALPFGLSLFVNGSVNDAKQFTQTANVAEGIAGNPAQQLAGTPKWTAAAGAMYSSGPWKASVTYKQVGDEVVAGAAGGIQLRVPDYDTINAAGSYDFGRFTVKLQGFNLLDRRALTNYVPSGNETALFQANGGFYTYQSGREILLTLVARF